MNDLPRYKTPFYWKGAFCFAAQELVNPQSELAQSYPHLYQVFRHRLESAYADRDYKPVSLCSHTNFRNGYRACRSDSAGFQHKEWPAAIDRIDPLSNVTHNRMKNMCSQLTDRMDVYGLAGEGSKLNSLSPPSSPPASFFSPFLLNQYGNKFLAFGSVFLARERDDDHSNPENLEHYAVKVQKHETMLGAMHAHRWDPPNGPVPDNRESLRYVPEEALIMLFLSSSERFPTLDSVYTHDRFQAIVMSPCIDYSTDRQPSAPGDYSRKFPAFTSRYLLTKDHKPLLNVSQGQKVATQLFQAMRQLADMNAWHSDISVNNVLVDKNLNVRETPPSAAPNVTVVFSRSILTLSFKFRLK